MIKPGLEYVSKMDLVTAALRELILGGELKPGMPLRQRDLARRLGVSVTPVREALRRLESEGLVAFNTHTGATVVKVDYGPTEENFLIRAALEALAAELATTRIPSETLDELDSLNEQMRECGSGDPERLAALNNTFHFTVYDSTESSLLISMIRRLWQAFGAGPVAIHDLDQSLRQHSEIIAALRAREPQAAADAVRNHILTGLARVDGVLDPGSSAPAGE